MKIKQWIKGQLTEIYNKERKKEFLNRQPNTFGLSRKEVYRAFQLGFTPEEYVIYDLKHNKPNDYISEWERQCFREKAGGYRIILDNKLIFYYLIKNFAPVNCIYAYKQNGVYVALEKGYEQDKILKQLMNLRSVVLKKSSCGGGEGFKLLEYRNEGYFINRIESTESDIEKLLLEDNYLLEEYFVQGTFENRLWPYSVNTIRIITIRQKNGEIEIAAAFQRIGVEKEKCIDNACAGGIYAVINIETGILSEARSHAQGRTRDKSGGFISFKKHPVTFSQIEGICIPGWMRLKKKIIYLHQALCFTNIPFIAWDVALSDDSFVIIEANTSCSVDFLQTFHGVRNSAIGLWMKENGYLK